MRGGAYDCILVGASERANEGTHTGSHPAIRAEVNDMHTIDTATDEAAASVNC